MVCPSKLRFSSPARSPHASCLPAQRGNPGAAPSLHRLLSQTCRAEPSSKHRLSFATHDASARPDDGTPPQTHPLWIRPALHRSRRLSLGSLEAAAASPRDITLCLSGVPLPSFSHTLLTLPACPAHPIAPAPPHLRGFSAHLLPS
ncbi:hypothetical protein VTO73DRAFT_774 [Trametes versicolor]